MNEHLSQGLLSETQELFQNNGWSLDDLRMFRMEYVPGSDGGTGDSSTQTQSSQGDSVQPTQQQQPSNPFLDTVDPAHRQVVEPYLKRWDADVTRRFQELHSQYRPYAELNAPVEDLQSAYSIYQQLNEDPKAFYELLTEALKDELGEQGPGTPNGQTQNLPFQGLPEDFQTDYQQTRQALEAVAQFIVDQQDQQRIQSEDAELDNYLTSLKQTHGEFDEEYVLAKMYATGMTGEQAIQAWKQSLQQFVNQVGGIAPKPGFKTLSGGGSVPGEAQKVTDLSRKDTKALVAAIMQQAQQE